MGKKRQQSASSQDHLARMSFLYQASHLMLINSNQDKPQKKQISTHFIRTLKSVAKKTQSRLDPSIKRTLCKNCESLLIPGISCNVSYKSTFAIVSITVDSVEAVECVDCLAVKKFKIDSKHKLFAYRNTN